LQTLLIPLYSGHQAVMLFFLLSGFVLSLPYERGKGQAYGVFLVRRVTRIYGPYLGALALAVAGALVWHGDAQHGPWLQPTWATVPGWGLIAHHVEFLGFYNVYALDPPFWSLVYEMRISLFFPALWLLSRKLGTAGSGGLAALFTAIAVILVTHFPAGIYPSIAFTLHYAGFFVVGIKLAKHHRKLLPQTRKMRMGLFGVSGLFYFYGMVIGYRLGLKNFAPAPQLMLSEWIVLGGAVGLILTAVSSPRLFHLRFPLFAGRISYSLYLVHFTILLALTFAFPALSRWIQLPIFLGLSFGIATLFCIYVEEPVTRWGRSLTLRSAAVDQRHSAARIPVSKRPEPD